MKHIVIIFFLAISTLTSAQKSIDFFKTQTTKIAKKMKAISNQNDINHQKSATYHICSEDRELSYETNQMVVTNETEFFITKDGAVEHWKIIETDIEYMETIITDVYLSHPIKWGTDNIYPDSAIIRGISPDGIEMFFGTLISVYEEETLIKSTFYDDLANYGLTGGVMPIQVTLFHYDLNNFHVSSTTKIIDFENGIDMLKYDSIVNQYDSEDRLHLEETYYWSENSYDHYSKDVYEYISPISSTTTTIYTDDNYTYKYFNTYDDKGREIESVYTLPDTEESWIVLDIIINEYDNPTMPFYFSNRTYTKEPNQDMTFTITDETLNWECTVGVEQLSNINFDAWFQNNTIHIDIENNVIKDASAILYNTNGALIFKTPLHPQQNTIEATVDLPLGMYLLMIKSNKGVTSKKLIKK